jgi:alcohol dehydrogenase, propanol-preferring
VRAYRLVGPGAAELVEVPEPTPGPGDVVLRVLAAGVCRTDLELRRTGGAGLALPVTLGHEVAGEVVAVGSEVGDYAAGARVAVYEILGCGRCYSCGRGEDNVCREIVPGAVGITRDGGMAEYVAVPSRNVVALGELDPLAAAPLTDAGMTALHAVRRGRALVGRPGSAVVVGIGGLGHLALQFLRATTEARVTAVDVDPGRLDFAAQLGAAAGVQAGDDAADEVLAANDGRTVDVVLDFVGSQASLDLAARVTGRGGAVVITGGGGGRISLSAEMGAGRAPDREVAIVHTFGGTREDLEQALKLAEAGRVRTSIERFGLGEAPRALDELEAGRVLGRAVLEP